MTDADCADDLALLSNSFAKSEFLLKSVVQAVIGITLDVNADKTEFMCFKQEIAITFLGGKHLKSVTHFT